MDRKVKYDRTDDAVLRQQSVNPNQLLNKEQAAKFLSVSLFTLHNWRAKKKGPRAVYFGRRCLRYRYQDILDFIEESREPEDSEVQNDDKNT